MAARLVVFSLLNTQGMLNSALQVTFAMPSVTETGMMGGIALVVVILMGSISSLWPAYRSSTMIPTRRSEVKASNSSQIPALRNLLLDRNRPVLLKERYRTDAPLFVVLQHGGRRSGANCPCSPRISPPITRDSKITGKRWYPG